MHPTAIGNCRSFFSAYAGAFQLSGARVIDIGSQDVNGSLRDCCPNDFEYVGVDFVAGKGVDLILDDPYSLPLGTCSTDIVVSNSCFEHSEMFWILFLEIMRILKPDGLFYLNAPSNGSFHQYPVDCWRFYPDSGRALVTWAKRNGMNPTMLESYTSNQIEHPWNDFVAVYVKDENYAWHHPFRILDSKRDITNGVMLGLDGYMNFSRMPEDRKRLMSASQQGSNMPNEDSEAS